MGRKVEVSFAGVGIRDKELLAYSNSIGQLDGGS